MLKMNLANPAVVRSNEDVSVLPIGIRTPSTNLEQQFCHPYTVALVSGLLTVTVIVGFCPTFTIVG